MDAPGGGRGARPPTLPRPPAMGLADRRSMGFFRPPQTTPATLFASTKIPGPARPPPTCPAKLAYSLGGTGFLGRPLKKEARLTSKTRRFPAHPASFSRETFPTYDTTPAPFQPGPGNPDPRFHRHDPPQELTALGSRMGPTIYVSPRARRSPRPRGARQKQPLSPLRRDCLRSQPVFFPARPRGVNRGILRGHGFFNGVPTPKPPEFFFLCLRRPKRPT